MYLLHISFLAFLFTDQLDTSKILEADFIALILTKANECEFICLSVLISGASIIPINIIFWKKLCQFIYRLFRSSYSCMILKTSYSIVPFNSSQNNYLPIFHQLSPCVISAYHRILFISIMQLSNQMFYYYYTDSTNYLLLFALIFYIPYLCLRDLVHCFFGKK